MTRDLRAQAALATARKLENERLAMRHQTMTGGAWLMGYGAKAEVEEDDDDTAVQITVVHDDGYARTYVITDDGFAVVSTQDSAASSTDRRCTLCRVLPHEADARSTAERMMRTRPYLGGCKAGQQQLARCGIEDMDGTSVQFWDQTESAWFSALILGQPAKKRGQWVVRCQDDTEYIIDVRSDVWKLDADRVMVENGANGMHVVAQRFDTASTSSSLAVFLETTVPSRQLHLEVWRRGVCIATPGAAALNDDEAAAAQVGSANAPAAVATWAVTSCVPLDSQASEVRDFGAGVKVEVPVDAAAALDIQEAVHAWAASGEMSGASLCK